MAGNKDKPSDFTPSQQKETNKKQEISFSNKSMKSEDVFKSPKNDLEESKISGKKPPNQTLGDRYMSK